MFNEIDISKGIGLRGLLVMVIMAVIISSLALSSLHRIYVASKEVREVDGVLYFPDGKPVRNYEQLYRYEHTPVDNMWIKSY